MGQKKNQMKKYKCTAAWVRHRVGQVIEEWEYNKLPIEIKRNFTPIPITQTQPEEEKLVKPSYIPPEVKIPTNTEKNPKKDLEV